MLKNPLVVPCGTRLLDAVLKMTPGDGPSMTMRSRCEALRLDPPEKHWNGTFTMKTK